MVDSAVEDEILKFKLVKALNKLPQRQRKVIQLAYFDRMGGDKIAQAMEINVQSVYNLTSKALVNLRKGLVSFFILFFFKMLQISALFLFIGKNLK